MQSVFDFHVHLGTWVHPEFAGITATVRSFDEMAKRYNVTGAVFTTADGPENALARNEELLRQIKENGNKNYYYFPWIRSQEPELLGFVQREAENIHGLKVHPSIDKVPFDDEAFEPYIRMADDHSWPILVHCGAWKEMSSYEKVVAVARRYRNAKFVMAHTTGGSFADRLAGVKGVVATGLANLYVDIVGTHVGDCLYRCIQLIGADRVLFGSDYPLVHPHQYRALIETLPLQEAERNLILRGNALRLLGH